MLPLRLLPLLAVSVLLAACGSGGSGDKPVAEAPPVVTEPLQAATALADGLVLVSVQNSAGQIELQQRFSVDAVTGEEQMVSSVLAGADGEWGTADDWQAAVVKCRYSAGSAVDRRLLQSAFFQPESLLSANAQACLWRHPIAGDIQVSHTGVDIASARVFAAVGGSPTGLILMTSLYGPLDGANFMQAMAAANGLQITPRSIRFSLSSAGLLSCPAGCEEIPVPVNVPADSCSLDCTGLTNIVYNPYAGLGLDSSGNPPPAGVRIYNGLRSFPVYADSRLQRLVQSIALNNPLAFPERYEEFHYSGDELVSVETYVGKGADGLWFNAGDVLGAYLTQQGTADGWQRLYYSGPGMDGVWKTADDMVEKAVILHRDTQNRIASVQVCNGAGADTVWLTADDSCRTLSFHYADTDAG